GPVDMYAKCGSINNVRELFDKMPHGKAFITAFRSGAIMGFLLAENGLLVLYISINLFKMYYGDDWEGLFEAITGYGLGGSSMALFGKVGGGIYTKAADVGADLVGKVERNIPEDDPHLHGLVFIIIFSLLKCVYVIADNVGDNVGDIAGMGSDLFGSYAESSCAALIKAVKEIEPTLKKQLIISTVLMTIGIAVVSLVALPPSFTIFNFGEQKVVKNWYGILSVCYQVDFLPEIWLTNLLITNTGNSSSVLLLVYGMALNLHCSPIQDVVDSCRTRATTNVIFGLALGYKSVIIPNFAIAISIFVSFSLAAMYGIAVAALGMLSTIATRLAIDAYEPINDNATGIAEMAGMSHRHAWYLLPYLANGSSGIASCIKSRAMLPYRFSAMTMKSVGSAALKMVEEVRRHINTIPGLMEGTAKLDYAACVKISTDASLKELIPPGCLMMLTPLIVGTLFGVETLSGVLAGALVSGV
ncbi:hypothetical protein KI387_033264, partial [Taxus chinensis]